MTLMFPLSWASEQSPKYSFVITCNFFMLLDNDTKWQNFQVMSKQWAAHKLLGYVTFHFCKNICSHSEPFLRRSSEWDMWAYATKCKMIQKSAVMQRGNTTFFKIVLPILAVTFVWKKRWLSDSHCLLHCSLRHLIWHKNHSDIMPLLCIYLCRPLPHEQNTNL